MKRNLLLFLFLLFSFIACKGKDKKTDENPSNPVNTAREFIRAALDGDFSKAEKYMLPDSVNLNFLDVARRGYQNTDLETKRGYRGSTIRIIDATTKLNDSTQVVIYSNTFINQPDTLKIIKIKGEWLVDFKYLYLHDMDTVHPKELINDKIK